jgi:hypothetical protein
VLKIRMGYFQICFVSLEKVKKKGGKKYMIIASGYSVNGRAREYPLGFLSLSRTGSSSL